MDMRSRWAAAVVCLLLAGCDAGVSQPPVPVPVAPAPSAPEPSAGTGMPHAQDLAGQLLRAILSGDETGIRGLFNGRSVDATEMSWLIGGPELRFGADGDRRSARQVLTGGRVLTRVITTEQADGSTVLEAVFLPERTAGDFGTLINRGDEARNFRDFVMCEFIHADGRTFMRNICFADTDVFDD